MALRTVKGSPVPEGAIKLSKEEALEHQRAVIRDWPSESDVFFLRYGKHISGLSSFTSSVIIANYFRNSLKAGWGSLLGSFFPTIVLPTVFCYVFTERDLTNNILLMNQDCPVCQQLKFAAGQVYCGFLFPIMYSFASYAGFATKTKSYPLPHFSLQRREFWKATFTIFKQGAVHLQTAGLIQTLVVLFLPYLQNREFFGVMSKLQEREESSLLL